MKLVRKVGGANVTVCTASYSSRADCSVSASCWRFHTFAESEC